MAYVQTRMHRFHDYYDDEDKENMDPDYLSDDEGTLMPVRRHHHSIPYPIELESDTETVHSTRLDTEPIGFDSWGEVTHYIERTILRTPHTRYTARMQIFYPGEDGRSIGRAFDISGRRERNGIVLVDSSGMETINERTEDLRRSVRFTIYNVRITRSHHSHRRVPPHHRPRRGGHGRGSYSTGYGGGYGGSRGSLIVG